MAIKSVIWGFLIALVIPVTCAFSQTVSEKNEANIDTRNALHSKLLDKAKHGDSKAQFKLGIMLADGSFDKQDETEGFYWILKATEKGYNATDNDNQQIGRVFFAMPVSKILKQCLNASYYLMDTKRYDDGIRRYDGCGQGSITGIDDVLAYLDFGTHLSHWVLAEGQVSGEEAVSKYFIMRHDYERAQNNGSSTLVYGNLVLLFTA